jgi:hypothetical protein
MNSRHIWITAIAITAIATADSTFAAAEPSPQQGVTQTPDANQKVARYCANATQAFASVAQNAVNGTGMALQELQQFRRQVTLDLKNVVFVKTSEGAKLASKSAISSNLTPRTEKLKLPPTGKVAVMDGVDAIAETQPKEQGKQSD